MSANIKFAIDNNISTITGMNFIDIKFILFIAVIIRLVCSNNTGCCMATWRIPQRSEEACREHLKLFKLPVLLIYLRTYSALI